MRVRPLKLALFLFILAAQAAAMDDPVQQGLFKAAEGELVRSKTAHPIYKAPAWDGSKLAGYAKGGWFVGTPSRIFEAVSVMMAAEGFKPSHMDTPHWSVYSDVFVQGGDFVKASGMGGDSLLYVLVARLAVKGAYTKVTWALAKPSWPIWKMTPRYEFNPSRHPEDGNEMPDVVLGDQNSVPVRMLYGQLKYAQQQLAAGSLPTDWQPVQAGGVAVDQMTKGHYHSDDSQVKLQAELPLVQRLQSDWNYRLWDYIKKYRPPAAPAVPKAKVKA